MDTDLADVIQKLLNVSPKKRLSIEVVHDGVLSAIVKRCASRRYRLTSFFHLLRMRGWITKIRKVKCLRDVQKNTVPFKFCQTIPK